MKDESEVPMKDESEVLIKRVCQSGISLEEVLYFGLTKPGFLAVDTPYSKQLRKTCEKLISRDSECEVIDNYEHGFCQTYPRQILIAVGKKLEADSTESNEEEKNKVRHAFQNILPESKHGRARCRFPVPAFRAFGKNICRSSTLSLTPEMLGHLTLNKMKQACQYALQAISFTSDDQVNASDPDGADKTREESDKSSESLDDSHDRQSKLDEDIFNSARAKDQELLKAFGIKHIFDLMVENQKEKFGMYVTSSEKYEWRKYRDFRVNSVPYPGCEHFTKFSENNRDGEGLLFDWDNPQNTAKIDVPSDPSGKDWSAHDSWDLVDLTKSYLKVMLENVKSEDSGGILVHCISGWDRTPMYISLMRLSLWADGIIHQSLSACEMVYLTVVYDWLSFNHNFKNRVLKNEEILYFSFDFLKYITGQEFSVVHKIDGEEDPFSFRYSPNEESAGNLTTPESGNAGLEGSGIDKDKKSGESEWIIHPFHHDFDSCFVSTPPNSPREALEIRKKKLMAVRAMLITAYKNARIKANLANAKPSIASYLSFAFRTT